ncbi:hypothetical protein GGS24DRAFT_506683 [Hypoxylon argillaceum]|nr:hypothetical protein GGS24DRAFT_506683 [Hypoxylon argillaceum]
MFDAEWAKYLLQNYPELDVNAAGGLFGSALQAAAYSGQKESVKRLLDKGANPNAGGGKYRSALNAAVLKGFWDIVKIWLDHGAKPDRCQLVKPDEEWLARIKEEEEGFEYEDCQTMDDSDLDDYSEYSTWERGLESGEEAVERYRFFWEMQAVDEGADSTKGKL